MREKSFKSYKRPEGRGEAVRKKRIKRIKVAEDLHSEAFGRNSGGFRRGRGTRAGVVLQKYRGKPFSGHECIDTVGDDSVQKTI